MSLYKKFGLAALLTLTACQKPALTDEDIQAAKLQATYKTAVGCAAAAGVMAANSQDNPKSVIVHDLSEEIRINAQADALAKRNENQTITDVGREIYFQSAGMQMGDNFDGIWDLVTNSCRKIYSSAETNAKIDEMAPK